MPAKSCSLNPIPTWLLKRLTPHIAPVICKRCNLSLHNGVFPTPLKQGLVLPILKKNNLDPDVASPSMMVKFHCSRCLTSAQLSTVDSQNAVNFDWKRWRFAYICIYLLRAKLRKRTSLQKDYYNGLLNLCESSCDVVNALGPNLL